MRRWSLIAACAAIGALVAFAYCVITPPSYVATAQVLLDPPKKQALDKDAPTSNDSLESSVVDSQIPLILSTQTLSSVVTQEHLDQDPEFRGAYRAGFFQRLVGLFNGGADDGKPDEADGIDARLTPVIDRLFNRVQVSRVAKSNVLSILVSAHEPWKAMRLANAISQTYVEGQVAVHVKAIQQMAVLFETRLRTLGDQVRDSENAVATFRRKNGLATTTDEKVTVRDQELTSLNEKLAVANSETADKRAKYDQAKRLEQGAGDPFSLFDVVRSPVVGQLRVQQAELRRREADLSETYGPSYPALRQIRAQRIAIDAAIADEKKRLFATLKNDYEVALAHENALRAMMNKLGNPQGSRDDLGVELRELERTNRANKALFENFLDHSKLTQEQPGFEIPDARIISPAIEPLRPYAPKTSVIVPAATLAGLILGLGLAAGLDGMASRRTPSRTRPEPVPATTAEPDKAVPVVGRIVAMDPVEWRTYADALDELDDIDHNAQSAYSASVASLAAKLERAAGQFGPVFAFAPLQSTAGCSTLVHCLARAIGTSGKRVLLIDADDSESMRSLSAKFLLRTHVGLSDVLRGALPFGSAMLPRHSFSFLPVGRSKIEGLNKRLGSQLGEALDKAKKHFDVILIDCPAIGSQADLAGWRGLSGTFFAVCNQGQLDDPVLQSPDTRLDGIVLNRLPAARPDAKVTRAI